MPLVELWPMSSVRPDPMRRAAGCVLLIVFAQVELVIAIVIAYFVAEAIAPSLAARGYNTQNGAGVFIAMGLGGIMAIYPVIWLHRLVRRVIARLVG